MNGNGASAFRARLARLEAWSGSRSYGVAQLRELGLATEEMWDAMAFVETLNPPGLAGQALLADRVRPSEIDRIPSSTRLKRLENLHRELHSHSSTLWFSERPGPPRPERFGLASYASWAGKPAAALFTSTGTKRNPGMWAAYMATFRGSANGPLFAWTLGVTPHSEIVIDSAVAWCEFATSHFDRHGLVDWPSVAEQVDAVRVTPRGVAAIEGFEFEYAGQTVPAAYWTVESTAWLRWKFDSVTGLDLSRARLSVTRARYPA